MIQPDRIHLRDHVISAEIGAFQSERGHTQRLRFTLTVDLRDPIGGVDDHVDRILSYDVLTQAIETALADQRYNLVETLAERIAAEILAHPRAAHVEVTVEKLDRAPGALGVTINRDAARVEASGTTLPVRILIWDIPVVLPTAAVFIVPPAPGLPLPQGGDQRRIALLALDQAAWSLAGRLGLHVAETRAELDHAIRIARPIVWAPFRLAVDATEAGEDPAGLGFWLARRLGVKRIDFAWPGDAPLPEAPPDLTLCRLTDQHD